MHSIAIYRKFKFLNVLTFFLCFILNLSEGFAQPNNYLNKEVTIHSPNVTELGKYGEYPVDLSTGVPSIDIPLYTVHSGKLALPISLSYHASGIKVDQESSSVGLGWSLNAGGFVSRVIRDQQDQDLYGFLFTGSNLPNYNSIDDVSGAGGYANNSTMLEWYRGKDKEPDIFNITANGLTDQFCLDNSGKYVSLGLDSLNFGVDIAGRVIIVKDKTGTIYRFGKSINNVDAYETTQVTNEINVGNRYVSSFYLTEMISADLADTIYFKYKTNYYSESKIASSTRRILYAGVGLGTIDRIGKNFDDLNHTYLTTIMPDVRIIDRISFRNGYVEFTSSDDRIDIGSTGMTVPNKTRITGYIVRNKAGQIIQSAQFENNGYFNRTGLGGAINGWPDIPSKRTKSLKLDAVKFYNQNNSIVNKYGFEYDPIPLPARNTIPQDFWGYYNGKSSNSTIIPQTFYLNSATGQPQYYGDNRNTDFSYMKAASLVKVTYPTGGYNVYEYEPNYYLTAEQSQNRVEQTKEISILAVNRLSTCDPEYMTGATPSKVVEFTVSEPLSNNGTAHLVVMFSDFLVGVSEIMKFKLTDLTSNQVYNYERRMSSDHQPLVFTTDIPLSSGRTYRMEANTGGVTGSNVSLCNSPYIDAHISYTYWVSSTSDQVMPKQVGGLRIKTISSFANGGTLNSKKKYEYGNIFYGPNHVGIGTLITDPSKNYYIYPELYATNDMMRTLKNVLYFTSDSQIELGANHGCPVSYSKVTEKQVDYQGQSANGKIDYYFDEVVRFHEPKSSQYFPYDFWYFPFWGGSTLKKEVQYSQSGSSYIPVSSTEHQYTTIEKRIKTLKNFEVEPDTYFWDDSKQWGLDNNPHRFYKYNYFVSRGKKLKVGEIVKTYKDGVEAVVTTKTFQEFTPYYDLRKESYVNSKGQTVEKSYKYTSDLDYPGLIARNQVSLPVQTEEQINGKVRDGIIIRYNNDGLPTEFYKSNNSVNPIVYSSSASVPSYYEKKSTLDYDSQYKSITSVKAEGQMPTIYIWSYNGEYPVAKITNASSGDVENTLGGTSAITAFSKTSPTDNQVNTFLAGLRINLPSAQVTTYTYKLLIGMTSQTDPKGMTSYYEYDSFQRLWRISDQNRKVVKEYNYNYQH